MTQESELRDKLRKIEALFSGTRNHGEKTAAFEATKRIKERLKASNAIEPPIEVRCSLQDYLVKAVIHCSVQKIWS